MLTINGSQSSPFCDGVSRRGFLKLGALGIGGLTLADVLRAESQAGIGSSQKAIINIHLHGGPSHTDMFDLKPEAPVEYRGEFMPIATSAPGLDICEHMPMLASMGDKFSVIRSLVGSNSGHDNVQTQSGYNRKSLESLGGRPATGSVISKLQGSINGAPPFVSYSGGSAGYLGPTFQPFTPNGSGAALSNLRMERSLTANRLTDRSSLLSSLDRIRRDVDASGEMLALDDFTKTAIEVVTSGRVADALDLKKEDPRTVARYGKGGSALLTARRLIQAGVRVVTMKSFGGWDTHGNNFTSLKDNLLPKYDRAVAALVSDLAQRGLQDDVMVMTMGEFGRTPRINPGAGRDHWPGAMSVLYAGGGLNMGQAIGSTNSKAEYPTSKPATPGCVLSTMYHVLGIDHRHVFYDEVRRRLPILNEGSPIEDLVG